MDFFRQDLNSFEPVQVDVPHKKVMLCLNESPHNPLDIVKRDFWDLIKRQKLNRYYSDITCELKNELAEYTGIAAENTIMGNGADELLYYTFLSVNEVNAFALTLSPSYFDYLSYCNSVGLHLKMMSLNEDFSFNTDEFLKLSANHHCRLIIICNPNNPTGNLFPQEQIEKVISSNPHKLVLLDETYFEFSGVTWANKIKRYKNLIIIRTFSKAFAAAGLRFGYLMANEYVIYNLKKLVTAFNLSILIQTMALAILKNQEKFAALRNELIEERENLLIEMNKLPRITAFNSYTNFILFKLDKSIDLFSTLLSNDIALRNVGKSNILRNCLRITVGSKKENKKFLEILKRFINEKV